MTSGLLIKLVGFGYRIGIASEIRFKRQSLIKLAVISLKHFKASFQELIGRCAKAEKIKLAYEKINVGDIKIFPAFNREYDCINHKTKENLIDFVDNSGLYFDDDTTYGRDISQDEDSKANVKRKRIKMGKMQ